MNARVMNESEGNEKWPHSNTNIPYGNAAIRTLSKLVLKLNSPDTKDLQARTERKPDLSEIHERWLPPSQEFLFSGKAAFQKLEQFVKELSKRVEHSFDLVVVLLPQNLTIKEVRYTEANTLFICDRHCSHKVQRIAIDSGRPFGVAVDMLPQRRRTRLVTTFVDHSGVSLHPPHEQFLN